MATKYTAAGHTATAATGVLNVGVRGTVAAQKALAPDPSCQPCPDCGGLQCLCRPRFFAGQLLSEQDLNRLDQYMVEKSKLHNRHLFGSGVVCGLEVKCAPCASGHVTVTPGYALSSCGEDIVVCKQDSVDICALIKRCRTDLESDCRPYAGHDPCEDAIEDWILAVRYAESPSRGITPLTGAGQGCGCSCGSGCSGGSCSCGGGSAANCGCGGSGGICSCGSAKGLADPAPLRTPRANRGAPPSCEPTLTCETYRYDVFRSPETQDKVVSDNPRHAFSGMFAQFEGDMMARIACCVRRLEDAFPTLPGNIANITLAQRQSWYQWACRARAAVAAFLIEAGGTDCMALAQVQTIGVPNPNAPLPAFKAELQWFWAQMIQILLHEVQECICSNALPQCPPAGDPRVPLALVRVRKKDCQVVSICNWTPLRHHVLTFPTIRYWFAFLPVWHQLRDWIHNLCCTFEGFDFGVRDVQVAPGFVTKKMAAQPTGAAGVAQPDMMDAMRNFAADNPARADAGLAEAIFARASESGGMFTLSEFNSAMRGKSSSPQIDPELIGTKRDAAIAAAAQSPQAGVLGAMLSGASPLFSMISGAGALGGSGNSDVAALKAMVAKQSKEIASLRTAVNRMDKRTGGPK